MTKCNLAELLELKKESQVDFAERADLARQTVQKLCSGKALRIEFKTISKICSTLGVRVEELITVEEIQITRTLKHARIVTVALGGIATKGETKLLAHLEDTQTLVAIQQGMQSLSSEGLTIQLQYFCRIDEWQTLDASGKNRAINLFENHNTDVLFIVGNGTYNGLTPYCLDKILKTGYDPRGRKPKTPIQKTLPYKLEPQEIWDVKNERILIKAPSDKEINELRKSDKIVSGAIIYFEEPNYHHRWCTIIGIIGLDKRAESLAAKHFFQWRNLEYLQKKLKEVGSTPPEPIFTVAKVEYAKEKSLERVEFIAISTAL